MLTTAASAKNFSTSYLSLELPEDWVCNNVNRDWACQPKDVMQQKGAVLVISAKQAGPQDHLDSLRNMLKTPQVITGARRATITSKMDWLKDVQLSGESWVECLHLNREIENFYTYYLGTVSRGLTILLSLSFQNDKSKQIQPILSQIRSSVRLTGNFTAAAPESVAPLPVVAPEVASQQSQAPTPAPPGPLGIPLTPAQLLMIGVAALALILVALKRK